MAVIVSPSWIREVTEELDRSGKIDKTLSFNAAAQRLIVMLSQRGLPFKVYQLGAGVKRITTETNICPCCKRAL